MLSQLGCVTLAPETVEAVYNGQPLTPGEETQVAAHPGVAYDFLSNIPRLEPIAWMIEHQNRPVPADGGPQQADIRKGAEILRLILAYEDAIHKGSSRNEAADLLARLNPKLSPDFFAALVSLDPSAESDEVRNCRIEELSPGMIVQQEIRGREGNLILSKGQEVTSTLIFRLTNLQSRRAIPAKITVSIPSAAVSRAKAAAASGTHELPHRSNAVPVAKVSETGSNFFAAAWVGFLRSRALPASDFDRAKPGRRPSSSECRRQEDSGKMCLTNFPDGLQLPCKTLAPCSPSSPTSLGTAHGGKALLSFLSCRV